MSEHQGESKSNRKTRRQQYAIALCIALPVVLAIVTFVIFKYNNRPVRLTLPVPTVPNPNGYDDFVRAAGVAAAVQHRSPLSLPGPNFTFADYELAAADAAPALVIMRQGLNKECLAPTVRSSKAINRFRAFSSLRALARTNLGVALYYEMSGKPAEATEARLDGMEMAVMLPRGGLLIDALVAMACEAIAESQFEYQLPLLNESQLEHVAARLDRIAAKRVPFADTMQEEGYYQSASDMELMNDPRGYQSFDSIRDLLADDDESAPGTGKKKPLTLKQNFDAASFLFANKANIIAENQRYNDAIVAEAKRPYRGASAVPIPPNLIAQVRQGILPQSRARFVAMEAELSILRTETALYRYKAIKGRFPDSLAELTPALLTTSAMNDPFGGVLKYRLIGKGRQFLLYSVGPDMKDDLGTPSQYVGIGPGDIVAGKLSRRRTNPKKR